MKKPVLALCAVLVILAGILLTRAALTVPAAEKSPAKIPLPKIAGADERLAKAVTFRTVSDHDPKKMPRAEFTAFHDFLARSFPLVHRGLRKETVNGLGLLYRWEGSRPDLAPVLLMAHQDVVPAGGAGWIHPPFSGHIDDAYIWGRGTLDTKDSLMAVMEAVEHLLAKGFRPSRTLYLAFGHDEEVGGFNGSAAIAALLGSRGVKLEAVLDEGGSVTRGSIAGISKPVALIGISEKGYASLELTAADTGGHASTPPPRTAAGRIARALVALETNQFPAVLDGPARQMFEALAPEMPFGKRIALANLWLMKPLVTRMMLGNPATAATVRTTTAVTMLAGSDRDNVLPRKASAVVNFRIRPGETVKTVLERVRRLAGRDVAVALYRNANDPTRVSGTGNDFYRGVEELTRALYPGTVTAPALVLGATDSRHYDRIARNTYRFVPMIITPDDYQRIHGVNERISREVYGRMIAFYAALIERVNR